jgi:ParB-like chromosome segregation protein Spo0J
MQIENRDIEQLIPYINNARTHSKEQVAQIAASIREFGWTTPILVDSENGIIAGHGRLMAARKLGMTEVPVIEISHLDEAQKKALIIADNKIAMNAGWDDEILALEIKALQDMAYSLDILGFDSDEIKEYIADDDELDEENPYTQKTDSPLYEPSDQKPELDALYDRKKYAALVDEIELSGLPESEKLFLILAAARHVVFNYQLIADYYAHSSPECQALMENSALVIVDYDKAIELGFVKLNQALKEQYASEYPNDAE